MHPTRQSIKAALLVAAAAALIWLTIAHVEAVNGTRFHRWGWGRLQWSRVVPAMLLASAPAFVALVIYERSRRVFSGVCLLATSTFLLQLVAISVQMDPLNPGRISQIVTNAGTTGYFTDAQDLRAAGLPLREILANYPRLLPYFHLHAYNKPPGPVLYWYFFLGFIEAPQTAALIGGIVLAVIVSLAVPLTYTLARLVTRDPSAAFFAAAWLSLIPAAVLIFPSIDQLFIVLGLLMLGTWMLAIETRAAGCAIACGASIALGMFFAYPMLVLGAFMALAGVATAVGEPRGRRMLARQCAITFATVVGIYLVAQPATGFNTIATFRSAWTEQQAFEAAFFMPRPHPQTVPSDFQDFFLGSGWISALLILYWLAGARRTWNSRSIFIVICLLQPVIVAATGLLRCETARLWAFMQPLVLIPVGLELSRWNRTSRAIAFACLLAILIVQGRNFIFQF
jgi:hypothetical protein